MASVRMKGKTVEEAKQAALSVLKAKEDEVEVKIIDEGESGVLGIFGGREAEVEVTLKQSIGKQAQEILQEILDRGGFLSLVNLRSEEEEAATLDIKGEDMGRIIGKEGNTIDALQYLLTVIFSKQEGKRIRVSIDAEGYRGRREKTLQNIARETAEKAMASGEEITLEPMNAAERRIIHVALQEDSQVTTYSVGERASRRVVVAPKGAERQPSNNSGENSDSREG